jgi:hypothetical protein
MFHNKGRASDLKSARIVEVCGSVYILDALTPTISTTVPRGAKGSHFPPATFSLRTVVEALMIGPSFIRLEFRVGSTSIQISNEYIPMLVFLAACPATFPLSLLQSPDKTLAQIM